MAILNIKASNLLILSFSYAPRLNPRAFRWTSLAEEFARNGASVEVITAWQPGLPHRETIQGVEIHRVGNSLIERIRYFLSIKRAHNYKNIYSDSCQNDASVLSKISNEIWRKIAWPDTTCVWMPALVTKANKLLLKIPDAKIVAVTPAFTAALAGHYINKCRTGGRWILDMGDPFSFAEESPVNNFRLYGTLNKRIERLLFFSTSAITVTNINTKRLYARLYPDSRSKIFVVPPLLNDTNYHFLSYLQPKAISDSTIRIVYIGTLYRKIRRPDFLLALFSGLSKTLHNRKLELHFYGNAEECIDSFAGYQNLLRPTIQLHGIVPQDVALRAIQEASAVINIGNNNSYQLPSKLVEYIAAEKPIINIFRCHDDASRTFLEDYDTTLNLHDSGLPPTIEQIGKSAKFILKPPHFANRVAIQNIVKLFQIENVAKKYAKIIFGN